MTSNHDLLNITAFFSVLFHAVVILGISFKLPDTASIENKDNTLDVVLINSSNDVAPDDAELVSSSDNQGGGKDEKEAESPLPYKAVDAEVIESIKLTAEQQPVTSLAPDQLITSDDAVVKIESKPQQETKLEAKQEQTGVDKITTKSERQLEKERLIAKLSKDWKDYQKRPVILFLSPATAKNIAAKYLDDWRKKVETVGNANYPVRANVLKLTGSVNITVHINRNGTIDSVKITKYSEHKLLNDSALRFVRDASPYQSFTDDIAPDKDVIAISRSFHFLGNSQLTTTDASFSR